MLWDILSFCRSMLLSTLLLNFVEFIVKYATLQPIFEKIVIFIGEHPHMTSDFRVGR